MQHLTHLIDAIPLVRPTCSLIGATAQILLARLTTRRAAPTAIEPDQPHPGDDTITTTAATTNTQAAASTPHTSTSRNLTLVLHISRTAGAVATALWWLHQAGVI